MSATANKIMEMAAKKGLRINIKPATTWLGSLNAAMSWQQGDRTKAEKMWAYAMFDTGYNAWVEPRKCYTSLANLKADVMEDLANIEFQKQAAE